ncbi:MAG: hypothetical protein CSA32_04095 [Desulfobulbus propionicus]|nr:MAG: hypothetical protein CSA32_04095 [Desulfobulbus propionicus]
MRVDKQQKDCFSQAQTSCHGNDAMSVSRLSFCQKCSPGDSSGSTIFGSILATHIPRYNELSQTTEPGTT